MDDYTNLKFASLFHDIGKFYQRAGKSGHSFDSKYEKLDENDYGSFGAHPIWSADFVKDKFDDLVENLVLYHHNPKQSINEELCDILQTAVQHSSNESIESEKASFVPLTSIFSGISLNNKKHDDYYVPLVELDFNKYLCPQNKEVMKDWKLNDEYNKLWAKFKKEFNLLINTDFESILSLLKKYTSTIPFSDNDSQRDISLYDHLKTTAAIANCRYLYSKEYDLNQEDNQEVYKIINGDISGIQKFIYKVSSPENAQSGMSKRLRGRSLYLTLLSEAIAFKIIKDLNLDSSNILFCGGGRFTVIAPNTSKAEEVINNIELEVNNAFIDKFNAELYLAIVSTNATGDDLSNFGKILSELTILLNENKKHKFINNLNQIFNFKDEINYDLCPVCGNPILGNDKLCRECRNHEDLGSAVANAEYLIRYESDKKISKSLFFSNLNVGYIFKKSKNDVVNFVNENNDVKLTISKLNDTDFLDMVNDISNDNVTFDFKVLGNNVPNIHGKPLYFNHLAQISKGANKFGILKMDVDNLGRIFSQGFDNDKENGASISKISSLSFYMDLFFSGYINQIVSKFKFYDQTLGKDELFDMIQLEFEDGKTEVVYKAKGELPEEFNDLGSSTIHINYSGGDDLLVVGPYDDIIEFAQEFRNEFKKWTSCNDSINISGGITITSPKFPIGKAAIMADDELEKSKDCGRDKITVFGEVLSWQSNDNYKGFIDIFKFSKDLEDFTSKKITSKGFVYSLLKIWGRANVDDLTNYNEQSWKNKNFEKLSTKRYVPILMYKLRLIKNKKTREDLAKQTIKYMPWIKTPVSWTSLRLR